MKVTPRYIHLSTAKKDGEGVKAPSSTSPFSSFNLLHSFCVISVLSVYSLPFSANFTFPLREEKKFVSSFISKQVM
jgi:hypothetical protein